MKVTALLYFYLKELLELLVETAIAKGEALPKRERF
jgi:predicted RNase H-like HicB family nuclease